MDEVKLIENLVVPDEMDKTVGVGQTYPPNTHKILQF
jgi:hypothetical protein